MTACPCGSGDELDGCCGLLLDGVPAPTALALMRSRYTAYVRGAIAYLIETHDPSTRGSVDRRAITDWSSQTEWLGAPPAARATSITGARSPAGAPRRRCDTMRA